VGLEKHVRYRKSDIERKEISSKRNSGPLTGSRKGMAKRLV
jgi:hypothetical protein